MSEVFVWGFMSKVGLSGTVVRGKLIFLFLTGDAGFGSSYWQRRASGISEILCHVDFMGLKGGVTGLMAVCFDGKYSLFLMEVRCFLWNCYVLRSETDDAWA